MVGVRPGGPSLPPINNKTKKALNQAIRDASTQAPPPKSESKKAKEKLAVLKANLFATESRVRQLKGILAKPPIVINLLNFLPVNRYSIPWLPVDSRLKTPAETRKILEDLNTSVTNIKREILLFEAALASRPAGAGGGSGQNRQDAETAVNTPPKSKPKKSPVEYNVSAVKEAYFLPNMSFFNKVDPEWTGKGAKDKFDSEELYAKNTPAKVAAAKKLWEDGLASKGMIQTHIPPGKQKTQFHDGSGNLSDFNGQKSLKRYGFQFIYNPETVTMTYGGVPPVDPNMMASGIEEYNMMAPSLASSTVQFTVVLNRMFDLKYIGPGGTLNSDVPIEKLWPANSPDAKTLKTIYEKGTMYDIEFLLKTLFNIDSFPSQLRGNTVDIGYLGAMQVQLHLGKNLRYVVIIESINVNHSIFNSKMVPMISSVSIVARRIPDYRNSKIVDGA